MIAEKCENSRTVAIGNDNHKLKDNSFTCLQVYNCDKYLHNVLQNWTVRCVPVVT